MITAPPSFCKCTCFTESYIIQLGSEHKAPATKDPRSFPNILESRAGAGSTSASCSLCNRAFCLSNNLPICKDAEEKDIFTTCFQRDSRKDQIIVLLFIGTTVGLLGWAGVRKIIEKRASSVEGHGGTYAAVGGQ
jgi:hypothetical protein